MPADAFDIARACALRDLCASGHDDARTVSLLDQVVADRRWWVDEWPDGAAFLPGLVAQDLQDALHDRGVRWPQCTACETDAVHCLQVDPPLDADPSWVCDEAGIVVAAIGALGTTD
ncbi:hypothetical protein [Solicola gregarius]|uniref:Uncharacterized protein n=1 Tax=Solicola gregarius TaxID=2908642 RepID=A0AA46TK13_9ACTN|nr:hypothetical protein [Solicola gregarius]UYM06736.1 hypothetical protein L0C25_06600 [Solicola gregarius]